MTQKSKRFLFSHERLRELLDYNLETGYLIWKVHGYRWPAGRRAGYPVKKGYRRLYIEGHEYGEHRVIWFWMTGEDPSA